MPSETSVSDIPQHLGYRISDRSIGVIVVGAGDFDGDGVDDLIVDSFYGAIGSDFRLVSGFTNSNPTWSVDNYSPSTPDTYTFPDEGRYRLVITATDDDGGVGRVEQVLVVGNADPIIVSPELQASGNELAIGQRHTFQATGSYDPGTSDRLAYRWEVQTNNGQVVQPSNEATFSFTPQYSGHYKVILTVSDNDTGFTMEEKEYTVHPQAVIADQENSWLVFDGSSFAPDLVHLPGEVLDGATELTIEFNIRSVEVAGEQFILDGTTSRPDSQIRLSLLDSGDTLRVRTVTRSPSGDVAPRNHDFTLPVSLSDDQWHRLAVVRDVATSSMILYLDGQLVERQRLPDGHQFAALAIDSQWLVVGGAVSGDVFGFNGELDDVRIWDVAKTAEDLALGQAADGDTANTNLRAWYSFNALPGSQTLHDASPHRHHATLGEFDFRRPDIVRQDGPIAVGSLVTLNALLSSPLAPTGPLRGEGSVTRTYVWTITSPDGEDGAATVIRRGEIDPVFAFVPNVTGEHTVTLRIEDRFEETVEDAEGTPQTVIRTITSDPNVSLTFNVDSPAFRIESDLGTRYEGSVVRFTLADLPALGGPETDATRVFAWTVLLNEETLTLPADVEANGDSLTFVLPDNGAYMVTVSITDTVGGEVLAPRTSTIAFHARNLAPHLRIPQNITVRQGATVNLNIGVSDAGPSDMDGLELIVDWGDPNQTSTDVIGFQYQETGQYTATFTLRDKDGGVTQTTTQVLVRPESPRQHPTDPHDVNDDGGVTPFDVLLIINFLNSEGAADVSDDAFGGPFLDVDGNNEVNPLDVLLVINILNESMGVPAGEPESVPAAQPLVAAGRDRVAAEQPRDRAVVELVTGASPLTIFAAPLSWAGLHHEAESASEARDKEHDDLFAAIDKDPHWLTNV